MKITYVSGISALERQSPSALAMFFVPVVTHISHVLCSNSISHVWFFSPKSPFPKTQPILPVSPAFQILLQQEGKGNLPFPDCNILLMATPFFQLLTPKALTFLCSHPHCTCQQLLCLYLQNLSRSRLPLTTSTATTLVKLPSFLTDVTTTASYLAPRFSPCPWEGH